MCEAVRRTPELLGKQIKLTGWYGSNGFWDFIGSERCGNSLIEPNFGPHTIIDGPGIPPQQRHTLQTLPNKFTIPFGDFHGTFYGTLRKRTGAVQSGPVPLDAAPNLDDMPLVLDVDKVSDVKFERSSVFSAPPEPR